MRDTVHRLRPRARSMVGLAVLVSCGVLEFPSTLDLHSPAYAHAAAACGALAEKLGNDPHG